MRLEGRTAIIKGRILLVDDDRDLVETISEALEAEEFEVITAHDGDRGWEMVRKGAPDLIVLDVMMPGRNGCEVARGLKQSEFASIPVIMLTGVAEQVREAGLAFAGGRECPADDYIGKPLVLDVLLASVHKLLGR